MVENKPARNPSIANRLPGLRTAIARESTMVIHEDMVVTESDWLGMKKWVNSMARRRDPTRDR
jgi:hypothetical protein